jgi:hypothetical protein
MSLKNPVTPPGIDPGTVRLVAQRLNHYATPGPETVTSWKKYIWGEKVDLQQINNTNKGKKGTAINFKLIGTT